MSQPDLDPFAGLPPDLEGVTWARPDPDSGLDETACPDCGHAVSIHLSREQPGLSGCMAWRGEPCRCERQRSKVRGRERELRR